VVFQRVEWHFGQRLAWRRAIARVAAQRGHHSCRQRSHRHFRRYRQAGVCPVTTIPICRKFDVAIIVSASVYRTVSGGGVEAARRN